MQINDLLVELEQQGITLNYDQGELAYQATQPPTEATLALIRQYKTELIHYLTPSSSTVTMGQAYPLTFAQTRLWFIDRLQQGQSQYNMPMAFRWQGQINQQALEKSLQHILERHSSLRTTFNEQDNQVVQIIHPATGFSLVVRELTDRSEQRLQEVIRAGAYRQFNLQQDILLYAELIQLPANEQLLLLTLHHIATDGVSIAIFMDELSHCYHYYMSTLAESQIDGLPDLKRHYVDYAEYEQQLIQHDRFQQQLTYWKNYLSGAPWVHKLPMDHGRSPLQQHHTGRYEHRLEGTLFHQLEALQQQQGTTLFVLLKLAFMLLLFRYSGEEDIVIGSPMSNRPEQHYEPLIGLFVNILISRMIFDPKANFLSVLEQVKQESLLQTANQQVPFDLIIEQLNPDRSLSYTPLVQIIFSLQNYAQPALQLGDLKLNAVGIDYTVGNFELTVTVRQQEQSCWVVWEYSQDLFTAERIQRLALSYETLLQGIVDNPEQLLTKLPIIHPEEQHKIIQQWNNTTQPYDRHLCLHEPFEQQVEQQPTEIALLYAEQQLTYVQLNQQANQLAHYLKSLGTKPGSLVGVYQQRGFHMVVAVLAVLKAGGAYVPLDPDYPQARLSYILEQTKAKIILTETALMATLVDFNIQLICLDDCAVLSQQPTTNISRQDNKLQAQHLAYIIFTSGSTGKPKGVMVQHQPVINMMQWVNKTFTVNQADRLLFMTSLCFDLSVYDIFGILGAGGSLRIVSDQNKDDPEALLHWLRTDNITFWDSAPAALQQLTPFFNQINPQQDKLTLRLAFLSGDWIPLSLPTDVAQNFPHCQVISLGGATEATVWSNYFPITTVAPEWPSIPYGKPIANANYYVVDPYENLCPVGIPGELYIGGECLSFAYFNQPQLTASSYVKDFIRPEVKTKLYRTGDLVRWKEDGNLEFVGRIDNQVKIRGYRIELGEVESVLAACPLIKVSVVLAREQGGAEHPGGNKNLVGYVLLTDDAQKEHDQDSALKAINHYLKQHLQDYMIPSALLILEQFPITLNGKVDRKALPAPEEQTQHFYEAPSTETETQLQQLWQQLLTQQEIGVLDHFFERGGHSLLATQLVTAIREQWQIDFPLRYVFEQATIQAQARYIDQQTQQTQQNNQYTEIKAEPTKLTAPLSFAQQRLWFIDELEGANAHYNIPIAIRLTGTLKQKQLIWALNQIIQRHSSLSTRFSATEQQSVITELNTLNIIDLQLLNTDEQQQQIQQIINYEAQQPFDLQHDLLLRAGLIQCHASAWVLTITLHHIAADGWSMGILVNELNQLYAEQPLTELAIQYRDFARWQREQEVQITAQDLPYWQEQLKQLPLIHNLPTDYRRPIEQDYQGAHHFIQIPTELAEQLQTLAEQQQVTLFMLLHSIFALLLARYSGTSDIVIGTTVANRMHKAIEPLIGFFVNNLVLRSEVDQEQPFLSFLKTNKNHILMAYEHQALPFELLVEQLNPERSLSHSPLFQILLVLHNQSQEALNWPGLEAELLTPHYPVSKFDLTLEVQPNAEGYQLHWEYATSLFKKQTIVRMADNMLCLLQSVVQAPTSPLYRLKMMAESEQQQLAAFNPKTTDLNDQSYQPHCLPQWVETAAQQSLDHIAIIDGIQQLSYRELLSQSKQVAKQLQQLGVKTETRVAVCLARHSPLIISLLAILQAGGAYVPIDPNYPRTRKNHMLRDSGAAIIISSADYIQDLDCPEKTIYRAWESFSLQSHDHSAQPLSIDVSPEQLSHLIYTSGSTGQPKGVAIEHRNVSALLHWAHKVFKKSWLQGVLASTSICFDLSIFEIFLPLSRGGTVILAENALAINVLPAKEKITLINTVPSAISELLRQHIIPEQVQVINLAGEPFSYQLQQQLYQLDHIKAVFNLYGPSEDTTYSSYRLLQHNPKELVDIGQPIDQTQAWILDPWQQLVPIGVAGELYLSGAGVAREYHQQPELTAEKFMLLPHLTSDRCYRTGDMALWLDEGNIHFLGREDQQIKLRGFRIELGEIEACLLAHPDIKQIAVVLSTVESRSILVAYSVFKKEPSLLSLQQWSQQYLPSHMQPMLYIPLTALPLTTNGKLDRNALPVVDPEQALTQQSRVAQTMVEQKILAIWQALLPIKTIGVEDNFFSLGGDSIIALQMVSRAVAQGIMLTTKQLFSAQTIAALADLYQQQQSTTVIEQQMSVGDCELLPIQFDHLTQHTAHQDHYLQSIVLQAPATLAQAQLRQLISALIQRHDALRLYFQQNSTSQWQGQFQPADPSQLKQIISEYELDSTKIVSTLSQIKTQIRCTEFPLFRVVWLKNQQQLVLVAHHLIIDGVSWRIISDDLALAWQQLQDNNRIQLSAKTTSYQQWAQLLSRTSLDDHAHWQQLVASTTTTKPTASYADSLTQSLTLTVAQTQTLLRVSQSRYRASILEILLACITYAGQQQQLIIALESHGRHDDEFTHDKPIDLSQTVGWFTHLYPVSFSRQNELAAQLQNIKQQLQNVPYKGIGYGLYARQHAPIVADILVNYLGQFDQISAKEWGMVRQDTGADVSVARQCDYAIEINGGIQQQQLQLQCRLIPDKKDSTLLQHCQHALLAFIQEEVAITWRVEDFPLATMTPKQLQQWQQQFPTMEELYPTTGVQMGLLYHSLATTTETAYVSQLIFDFEGELNPDDFAQAWQQVVDHHPSLRTTFVGLETKQGQQLILSQITIPWQYLDWSHESVVSLKGMLLAYQQQDKQQAFDLNTPPLMRFSLLKTQTNRYQLLWSYHHSLLDGWSIPLVLNDVMQSYQGLVQQREITLRPVIPFTRYIQWLQQQNQQQAENFWESYIQQIETLSPLSYPELVDEIPVTGILKQTTAIPEKLQQHLKTTAAEYKITLNTLLQAAWAYVLHRYSGEQTILFAETVSGRPAELADIELMLGLFINTLPVVITLPEEQSIEAWLQQIQQQQQQKQEFAYYPLHKILNLSHFSVEQPLLQSLLVFENFPVENSALDLPFSLAQFTASEDTNYTITLQIQPQQIQCLYHGEDISTASIHRILAHYLEVLTALTEAQQLTELNLLVAQEKQQLQHWNQTTTDHPQQSLAECFVQQVHKTPYAQAIRFENHGLTYYQLNKKANQCARFLQQQGVQAQDIVAIDLVASEALIISILAIIKIGGVYLPLDPDHPAARIEAMLSQLSQPWLITTQHAVSLQVNQSAWLFEDIILTDYDDGEIAQSIALDDPAFILFTSGSTGIPKGVLGSHRNVMSLVFDPNLSFSVMDVVAQSASISFDAFIHELWGSLLQGACLLGIEKEILLSPPDLKATLITEEVSFLFATTGLFNQLVKADPEIFNSLKWVIFGGEAHNIQLIEQVLATGGPQRLTEVYGPTEATTYTTTLDHDFTYSAKQRQTAIGKVLSNHQLFVLDQQQRRVPIGCVGELYIAGEGVTLGYFMDSALTAEHYVTLNIEEKNIRAYRTGDLVRFQENGLLEFVARTDHQVKIRGYRIELDEISVQLNALPGVKQAVILVRKQRILAYLLTDHTSLAHIQQQLRAQLPNYMQPSGWLILEEFPLTVNGKIDKDSLPDIMAHETKYVAPRTVVEEQLCTIWQQILGLSTVGIDDNFFELGGHSLLAMQLVTLAAEQELYFNSQDLLRYPTVHSLQQQLKPYPLIANNTVVQQHWFAQQPGHLIQREYQIPPTFNLGFIQLALQAIYREHPELSVISTQENWLALGIIVANSEQQYKEQQQQIIQQFEQQTALWSVYLLQPGKQLTWFGSGQFFDIHSEQQLQNELYQAWHSYTQNQPIALAKNWANLQGYQDFLQQQHHPMKTILALTDWQEISINPLYSQALQQQSDEQNLVAIECLIAEQLRQQTKTANTHIAYYRDLRQQQPLAERLLGPLMQAYSLQLNTKQPLSVAFAQSYITPINNSSVDYCLHYLGDVEVTTDLLLQQRTESQQVARMLIFWRAEQLVIATNIRDFIAPIEQINQTKQVNQTRHNTPHYRGLSAQIKQSIQFQPLIEQQQGEPQHTPIYWLPPGGGGAESYFGLTAVLNNAHPTILIENIEYYHNQLYSLSCLVNYYSTLILHDVKQRQHQRVILAGVSKGGVLAHLISVRLAAESIHTENLFLIDPCAYTMSPELIEQVRQDERLPHYTTTESRFLYELLHLYEYTAEQPSIYSGQGVIFQAGTAMQELPPVMMILEEYFQFFQRNSARSYLPGQRIYHGLQPIFPHCQGVLLAGDHSQLLTDNNINKIATYIQRSLTMTEQAHDNNQAFPVE